MRLARRTRLSSTSQLPQNLQAKKRIASFRQNQERKNEDFEER